MKKLKLRKLLRRFDRDSKGSVLIYTAFGISGLLGMVALGVDVGTWYSARRDMQSAADAAAIFAAFEIKEGTASATVIADARTASADNGYTHADGTTVVTVVNPPTSGDYAGLQQYVTVRVEEESPSYLSAALEVEAVNVAATATALAGVDTACIVALNHSMAKAIQVNNGDLKVLDCGIRVNSDFADATSVANNKEMEATGEGDICIKGSYAGNGDYLKDGSAYTPRTDCPRLPDPLASLTEPSVGACLAGLPANLATGLGTGSYTLNPGTYCDEVNLNQADDVTFNPGLYVFRQGLQMKNNIVTALGVTWYFTDDDMPAVYWNDPGLPESSFLKIQQDGTLTLQAPVDATLPGTIPGVAIFASRNQTAETEHIIRGAGDLYIEGALYYPVSGVSIQGNSTSSTAPFTMIIADHFKFSGQGTFTLGSYDTSTANVPSPVDISNLETDTRIVE